MSVKASNKWLKALADRGLVTAAPPKRKRTKPAEADKLQLRFAGCWRQLGGPELTPEYRFHPKRKYRLDFALPAVKIGIEIDGGTWSEGRTGHNWGVGITRDHEKQNLAVFMGWRIFRFTTDMLADRKVIENLGPVIEFAWKEIRGS